MSYYYSIPLVSEAELARARSQLGPDIARILGYFREDGARSIVEIEEALAERNAAAMVRPAHTLKGESYQFGAHRLGEIAEVIEKAARRCVEQHSDPVDVAGEVAMLRGCFAETLALLGGVAPVIARTGAVKAGHPATSRPAVLTSPPRTFGRRGG